MKFLLNNCVFSFQSCQKWLGIFLSDIRRELSQDNWAAFFCLSEIIGTVVFADTNVLSQSGTLFDGRKWNIIFFAESLD